MRTDDLLSGFGRLVDGQSGEVFDLARIKTLIAERRSAYEAKTARGDFVLFKLSNHADFFVNLFCCWDLGLIPVIIPPRSTAFEVENICGFFQTSAIFSDEGVEFFPPTHSLRLSLPQEARDSTALVLLTSGTLGDPKAIFLSFQALREKFSALARVIPFEERRNTMCVLPLCFGHGLICNSLFPLLNGSTLVIYPAFELTSIPLYLGAIGSHQINFFSTVPVILRVFMQHKLPPHDLRRVHCASAPLLIDDWKAADKWLGNGVSVTHVYGLTEFSGWVAGSEGPERRGPGYVGQPWGTEIKIRDGQSPGEVLLRGGASMSGYVAAGIFHPVSQSEWFATGDVGQLDERGYLTLLGRHKDIINYGGFKVHPEDIDALLAQHPAVQQVCTFAMTSENLGEVPAVALILKGAVTERELKTWCVQRIHSHKIPVRWYFVDRLPVNERGKTSRRKVREYCEGLRAT